MDIFILTICPESMAGLTRTHVIERASGLGHLRLTITDIREYADGCFRKVDDSPYGGGAGMIMRIEPVMNAIRAVTNDGNARSRTCIAAFSPTGAPYTQQTARSLLAYDRLVLVCGHYEGMDERIFKYMDKIISMGDYILSGGEIPAMAVTDSVARLLPGVLRPESLHEESFSNGLLEYPQYTRPSSYNGDEVPPVLLSGDHAAIRRWREEQALARTRKHRPDLLLQERP